MPKRDPQKTIKTSEVARLTGLSSKTIKRYADKYGWTRVRYQDHPTSPVFLYESEVFGWLARRQQEAS